VPEGGVGPRGLKNIFSLVIYRVLQFKLKGYAKRRQSGPGRFDPNVGKKFPTLESETENPEPGGGRIL
jgi:hypothetical protein